ncbi:MAG TPA: GUN4 domain-containing protein, partial [Coleofasciculaceae cyanobacterium]
MITPENARSYAVFVKQYARNGEISAVARPILQRQQTQLKLTPTEAQAIERRVLQLLAQAETVNSSDRPPVLVNRSSSAKSTVDQAIALGHPEPLEGALDDSDTGEGTQQQDSPKRYEQEFLRAIQLEFPPGDLLRRGLKQIQESLGLADEAVETIESQVSQRFQAQQDQYQDHLWQYEQAFSQAVALGIPFNPATQTQLADLRHSLKLQKPDTDAIEGRLLVQNLVQPESTLPTELSDSPPTKLPDTASPATAPTAQPAELSSFISAQDMPPGEFPAEPAQPIATLAQAVEAEPVSLRSEKGVDYVRLRDLLQQQKWQDADRETLAVMLKAADRTEAGWLDPDSLTKFPCMDLHTIDRLWRHYSKEKFGFRAQWLAYPIPKRSRTSITSNVPARVVHEQVLEFTKKMDWWTERMEFLKYYKQLTFNLEAPRGHLPALWFWAIPWWKAAQNGGIGPGRGGCSVDDQTLPTFMARLRV